MCSSQKSSRSMKVKKIGNASLSKSELSDFIAIANAADARREKREQAEQAQARKLELQQIRETGFSTPPEPVKHGLWGKLAIACHL